MLSNSVEYAIADVAIMFAGKTRVSINTMTGVNELDYIVKDADIEVIFVDGTTKMKVSELNIEGLRIIPVEELNKFDAMDLSKPLELPFENITTSPAIIAYTGGTTGQPKGAVYSHDKLLLVLLAHITELELSADDKLLLLSPFAHSAGMILLAGLLRGATIITNATFVPEKTLATIQQEKITFTFMVPTMIYRLLDAFKTNPSYDVSSVKTILYGASPIYEERLKEGINLFGPIFTQLYGQTESYNFITRLTKKDHIKALHNKSEQLKSCGRSVLLSTVKSSMNKGWS